MTNLKDKLKQAEASYRQGIDKFQQLQHDLIAQEGAIAQLRQLIEEAEKDAEN